jgi:F-type H+/Na+-transporting ATPase subunit alpha
VPVPQVARAEQELLQFVREEHAEVRDAIVETKALSDETEQKLQTALSIWRDRFKTNEQLAAEAEAEAAKEPVGASA